MNTEAPPSGIRVFAAIRPSGVILGPLQDWWASVRTLLPQHGWRPIPCENWHVTLAFYGELDAGDIPVLCTRLDQHARQTPALTIETRGVGVFPGTDRPRTLWVGAFGVDPPQALAELANRCRHTMDTRQRIDLRKSPQTFRGHISMARSNGRQSLDMTSLNRHAPPNIREQVDAISLYRSELTPQGSRYTLIERFPLKA